MILIVIANMSMYVLPVLDIVISIKFILMTNL